MPHRAGIPRQMVANRRGRSFHTDDDDDIVDAGDAASAGAMVVVVLMVVVMAETDNWLFVSTRKESMTEGMNLSLGKQLHAGMYALRK